MGFGRCAASVGQMTGLASVIVEHRPKPVEGAIFVFIEPCENCSKVKVTFIVLLKSSRTEICDWLLERCFWIGHVRYRSVAAEFHCIRVGGYGRGFLRRSDSTQDHGRSDECCAKR
jgi:hypothetical protein